NFSMKLFHAADRCVLAAQNWRIEINHTGEAISIKRHGHHIHFTVWLHMMEVIRNLEVISIRILILISYFFQNLNERHGTTIHDGHFWTVYVDQHVVHL